MPRPPRVDFPGAVCHVTSRGNGRADIQGSGDDRERFLGQLAHHLRLAAAVACAYVPPAEARIGQYRSGRRQDWDPDLPRWTVPLDEIDAAVARPYGVDRALLSAHGRRAGAAKAAAVELAARLADVSHRAVGVRYGIGAAAVGAIHRRLQDRPDVLQAVESLARKLGKTRTKLKVQV